MKNMAAKTTRYGARDLPIASSIKSEKIRHQVLKDYYENKIKALIDLNLPPHLVCLACWDAPVRREDLRTDRDRRRFVRRCLKYYHGQLKEIEREQKKF